MIIHPAEQGSAGWHMARLAIPTASNFDRIVTPRGKLSAQRDGYLFELVAEWLLGHPLEDTLEDNYWIARGHELEPQARAYYALQRDIEPTPCGFIYRDETRLCGASPDWLVGEAGCAEVKAPKASTHVGYLLGQAVPDKYIGQVQGQLYVTGRAWCDWMSFYPGLPPVILRTTPDPAYQAALAESIPAFTQDLLAARARLAAHKMESPAQVTERRPVSLLGI